MYKIKKTISLILMLIILSYTSLNTSVAMVNNGTKMFEIHVGNKVLEALFEDTQAALQLQELLAKQDLNIAVHGYGGFEIVGELPYAFHKKKKKKKAYAGDIMLYQGRYIVVFYGTNSYTYTKIGHIIKDNDIELETILGSNDISNIRLSLKK